MGRRCSVYLTLCILTLVAVTLALQLTAIFSYRWANYVARIDLGKPNEEGHYGLWTLCFIKGPVWVRDCDSMDTFFEVPPYVGAAGVLAILHLLQLVALIPLAVIRCLQVIRSTKDLLIKSRILCLAKVVIAFLSVMFSILVAILASVGENKVFEYTINKGWSFWVQISVIAFSAVTTCLCAVGNFLFWKQCILENADPWGQRSETYGNPSFTTGSPNLSARTSIEEQSTNGNIAYTETSGEPYSHRQSRSSGVVLASNKNGRTENYLPETSQAPSSGILTYENLSFQQYSPSSRKKTGH